MKILICNERFMFRFGVDRVLLSLGKYFRDMGHSVIMMGNRLDSKAVDLCADRFVMVPGAQDGYQANEFTREWLEANWDLQFSTPESLPDIALVAGWPFYLSLDFLKEKCGACIVHDHGGVPLDRMEGRELQIQLKLRWLRYDNLSKADEIIAISHFIEESQSRTDAKGKVPTISIYHGLDHMRLGLWAKQNVDAQPSGILDEVRAIQARGTKLILALGRLEFGNYKNSEAAFSLLRRLKDRGRAVKLLVLANEADVPKDLRGDVKCLGYLSDEDLDAVMGLSDIGIATSLWEGFDLPLGEMQLTGRPVYVFNRGAHREVVIDPYYLCETPEELCEKVLLELDGKPDIQAEDLRQARLRYQDYFTWKRCALETLDAFTKLLYQKYRHIIFMDVTHVCKDAADTGAARVTRHIARNIQERAETVFICWDEEGGTFVFPCGEEIELLCADDGPKRDAIRFRSAARDQRRRLDDALHEFKRSRKFALISGTMDEDAGGNLLRYFHRIGAKAGAILQDPIPVVHPETAMQDQRRYRRYLSECDLILPASDERERELLAYWEDEHIRPAKVAVKRLPDEPEDTAQADGGQIRVWQEYTLFMLDQIYTLDWDVRATNLTEIILREKDEDLLFEDDLGLELAIRGALRGLKPECVICLGMDWNIDRLAKEAALVYSISDGDEDKRAKNHFPLKGAVSHVLPVLLHELEETGISPYVIAAGRGCGNPEILIQTLERRRIQGPLVLFLQEDEEFCVNTSEWEIADLSTIKGCRRSIRIILLNAH